MALNAWSATRTLPLHCAVSTLLHPDDCDRGPRLLLLQLSDFEQVVKQDRRLAQAGLKDVAGLAKLKAEAAAQAKHAAAPGEEGRGDEEDAGAAGQGDDKENAGADGDAPGPAAGGAKGGGAGSKEPKQGRPKKKKAEPLPPIATKPITAFFRPAPAAN